jgi:hypothetical protein
MTSTRKISTDRLLLGLVFVFVTLAIAPAT